MFNSLKTSLKLRNAYRVNSFIYSIFQLPILKLIDSKSFYKSKELKVFFGIFSTLWDLFKSVLIRATYMLILCLLAYVINPHDTCSAFLTLFIFFVIIASTLKNYLFDASKEKYYALTLINMNSKAYAISNYLLDLIKVIVTFIPVILIVSIAMNIPILTSLLLPILEIFIRLIVTSITLIKYEITKKLKTVLSKFQILLNFIFAAIPFILAYNNIYITNNLFYIIFIVCLILSIFSIIKINNFSYYKTMYRELLNKDKLFDSPEQKEIKAMQQESISQIDYDKTYKSSKTGYAYFHDLFVNRHRKILVESATKQSITIITLCILCGVLTQLDLSIASSINTTIMSSLPFFVIIMYALNRGVKITQAMFMNCDHSLLTYNFYRKKEVILGLFKQRLKTLISIDLIPSISLATGLVFLLFISGGTRNLEEYAIVFISIISMSIFFSIHNLVLYYLFQPYNVHTESKSATLRIAQVITYYACFYICDIDMPLKIFGIGTIVFCFAYSIISLIIVYKFAPKTFKLRN